jgi:acyl-coenzyme A synthetase/AMP-(fatty) acid ligase
MNITDSIRRHAERKPDSAAVIRPNGLVVSYGELDRTIDCLASGLQGLGLTPGSVAMAITKRPYRDLCLRLAFARLGIASAATSMPADCVTLVLTEAPIPADAGAKLASVERVWPREVPRAAGAMHVPSHQDPAAACAIFPTSGTTGLPKFVAVSHAQLAQRVATKPPALQLPADARQICMIGAGTGYGFMHRLAVLFGGGTVVMAIGVQQILPLIAAHRVTHLALAPFSLQRLLQTLPAGVGPLPSLRQIEVGGSALAQRLRDLARQRLCANIVTQYGSAEAGPVAGANVDALQGRRGAVGYGYPGVEIEVVGDDDAPVPAGTEGILRVRGAGCAHAYVGDPTASASVFKGGWVYPGDRGIMSNDGLLSIRGRAGDVVINQGGLKVNPQVVEDVLMSVPEVVDAAAFGVPDPMGIARIWAAVVADEPLDIGAVEALCRERLKHNAPVSILQLDVLPRNDAGKVMRGELRQRVVAAHGKRSGFSGSH